MGNKKVFTNKVFDYKTQKVKITGNIKKTIDFFKKLRIAYERLFHMFCEINEYVDDRKSMFSDIWYSRKRGSGIPVINGVLIDETAYEMYVWKLRDIPANVIIEALFFGNNDSAFECGFLKEEINNYNSCSIAIFNPSPFLIESTIQNDYKYIVSDGYFSSAYENTYRGERFYTYEERESSKTLIGIVSNDYDVFSFLNLIEYETQDLIMSISCSMFKKNRESILSQLKKCGLNIYKVLFVDGAIFETAPKRRAVIYASRDIISDEVLIYNMRLVNGKEMTIEDDSFAISYDYLTYGRFSFNDVKMITDKSKESIQRRKPQTHEFSDEIKIQYRYVNRNGRVSAIASYNSIPDEKGKSKRLIKETEKGLRFKSEGELPYRLDNVAFDEKNYEVISNDIKRAFMGRMTDLSLKSLWYVNRNELFMTNGYEDDVCRVIFNSKYLIGSVKCESIFDGAFLEAIKQLIDDFGTVGEKEKVVKQLYKLFNVLIIKDVVSFNPFSDILRNITNRMEEEQYEVRNALTKKNLSMMEQRKMLRGIVSDGDWRYTDNLKLIIVFFRLFTAVPIREMMALNWGDIQYNKDYDFTQVSITRAIDRKGKLIEYGERGDWIKRRMIPLVPELETLLILKRKKLMRNYSLSEDSLNGMPLFSEKYSADGCRRMKYEEFNDIYRKAILEIEIPEMIVKLPGEREVETDLNRFYSDIFISNFKYMANHICYLKAGEISHVLGMSAADTKDIYYIDYDNDAIQYEIYKKLCRWSYLLYDKNTEADDYSKRYSNVYKYRFASKKQGKINIEVKNELGVDIQLTVVNNDD